MSFNERSIWWRKTILYKEYLTGCRSTSFWSYVLKWLQNSRLIISFSYSSWFPLSKVFPLLSPKLKNCFVLLFPLQFLVSDVEIVAAVASFPLLIQHISFCPLSGVLEVFSAVSYISLFLFCIPVFMALLDLFASSCNFIWCLCPIQYYLSSLYLYFLEGFILLDFFYKLQFSRILKEYSVILNTATHFQISGIHEHELF